jgi:hypothetical protein
VHNWDVYIGYLQQFCEHDWMTFTIQQSYWKKEEGAEDDGIAKAAMASDDSSDKK